MRWAILVAIMLAGCTQFFHGDCWEMGRQAVWTEPDFFQERLADGNWTATWRESNLPEDARFNGTWIWLKRDLGDDAEIRIGSRDGEAFLGGIVPASMPDGIAADIVEDFVLERTGLVVEGMDHLGPRRDHDPHRLFRGALPGDINVTPFLELEGQWQAKSVGSWEYHVAADHLFVLIPTLSRGEVVVDAGDRIQGPFVDGEAVPDEQIRDAAMEWWSWHGYGKPSFQDFDRAATEACT